MISSPQPAWHRALHQGEGVNAVPLPMQRAVLTARGGGAPILWRMSMVDWPRRVVVVFGLPFVVTMAGASAPAAQSLPPRMVVPSEPTCGRCRIVLRRVAQLGEAEGPGSIAGLPTSVTRDSRGRFYLVQGERSELPLVFSPTGAFLRSLGRLGSGPGEFRWPRVVLIGRHDSALVLDEELGVLTVFDSAYRPQRTARFPFRPWTAALLDPEHVVVNARIGDAARIGLPLHVFRTDGTHLRSFGSDRPVELPGQLFMNLRWLWPASDGSVWSLRESHRYSIERWDPQGRKVIELDRDAEWFRPYADRWLPTPTVAPAPYTSGMWQDAEGLLWVLTIVPDPQWARGLGDGLAAEGQTAYAVTDIHRVYDTIVEVIDPTLGRVVARSRVDARLDIVVDANLIAESREEDQGYFTVRLWRAELYQPPRRGDTR